MIKTSYKAIKDHVEYIETRPRQNRRRDYIKRNELKVLNKNNALNCFNLRTQNRDTDVMEETRKFVRQFTDHGTIKKIRNSGLI